jgi:hypothetical protein
MRGIVMATRRSHRHSQEDSEREESVAVTPPATREEPSSPAGLAGEGNGVQGAKGTQQAPGNAPEKPPVMQRAEELADDLGQRIGHYASIVGFKILQFAARAREEAEDIWAEAQNIRRGNRPSEKGV